MKIQLEVRLGNAAMQTYEQVQRAIEDAMGKLYGDPDPGEGVRVIRDRNGNSVGEWVVSE